MSRAVFCAFLMLSAFGSTVVPAPTLQQQHQAALDRIADHCGAPRDAWKLLDQDHVTLQSAAFASGVRGNCLISELFKSKLPIKLGFVAQPRAEGQGQ